MKINIISEHNAREKLKGVSVLQAFLPVTSQRTLQIEERNFLEIRSRMNPIPSGQCPQLTIDKFTIDGEYLYALKMGESLNYPNDIYAINNTVLAVADSVNHRVIGIEDGNPKGRLDNSRIIWQLNVERKIGALGLDWPTAINFSANGRSWVKNQNLYFNKGEIVVYDAIDFSFLHPERSSKKIIVAYDSTVIPLNDDAEPRNFTAIKNFMLIGNFSPIEILKIDDFSLAYGSFLDGIMHNKFVALSESRDFWLSMETFSKYAIGLFVLLLLYGGYLESKEISRSALGTEDFSLGICFWRD